MKPEKTYSQSRLYDQGFDFAKLQKNGLFVGCKNRRGATHALLDTKISVIATPLKVWPKHKSAHQGYGKPRYSNFMNLPTTDKLEIPVQATHLMYSTSRVAIIATVDAVNDFMHMRGRLQFGTYNANSDRFTILCADGTPLVDGTSVVPFEHRTMKHVVREREVAPAKPVGKLPKPPKAKIATTPANAAPAAQPINQERGKLSRFIDALIMEGTHTVADIVAQVVATFPDRTPQKAKGNVLCRHFTLKAAKKNPPAFAT